MSKISKEVKADIEKRLNSFKTQQSDFFKLKKSERAGKEEALKTARESMNRLKTMAHKANKGVALAQEDLDWLKG
ncbi:MAG: hypothetical protein EAZ57_01980 [Cytophagales bacterium]|nr:MAG: hypothetical protein EAZ67_02610 [Cytophagales bacterium]TAF61891.1 MAG: hypothetical protein EAZ57_01980 [Cytophagales bacterium]